MLKGCEARESEHNTIQLNRHLSINSASSSGEMCHPRIHEASSILSYY
jgi:hypothetical protein